MRLLAAHDESVSKGLDALRKTTDRHLATPWKLLAGGRVALEQPRYVVIADTFTHLAHHRGQLTDGSVAAAAARCPPAETP